MVSRLDNFEGRDVDYIHYLETTVRSLRCRLESESSREGLIEPEGVINNQATGPTEPADGTSNSPAQETPSRLQTATPSYQTVKHGDWKAIQYNPHPVQEKIKPVPQWRGIAQKLVRETPVATEWICKLQQAGLYEAMDQDRALTYLLDISVAPDLASSLPTVSNDTVDHVRQYAQAAATRAMRASVALKLANFQKILVLSACAVLLEEGHDQRAVIDAAKLCMGTNVDDNYCKRLVATSKYVNRLIDSLNVQGWGNRASELLMLWDRSPSAYFLLASSAEASLRYLVDVLCTPHFTGKPGKDTGRTHWTAVFVPSIVHHILRNKISVERISHILGYKNAHLLRIRKNTWKLQRRKHAESHPTKT